MTAVGLQLRRGGGEGVMGIDDHDGPPKSFRARSNGSSRSIAALCSSRFGVRLLDSTSSEWLSSIVTSESLCYSSPLSTVQSFALDQSCSRPFEQLEYFERFEQSQGGLRHARHTAPQRRNQSLGKR